MQIFDEGLFRHIVEQTNLYVRQKRAASYKWEDLTVPELKAFMGIWIFMGFVKKPAIRDYWSQGLIEGEFPIITDTFPRNRFLAILGNLHFNDNALAEPRGSPGYDKLHKIRPVLDTHKHFCPCIIRTGRIPLMKLWLGSKVVHR